MATSWPEPSRSRGGSAAYALDTATTAHTGSTPSGRPGHRRRWGRLGGGRPGGAGAPAGGRLPGGAGGPRRGDAPRRRFTAPGPAGTAAERRDGSDGRIGGSVPTRGTGAGSKVSSALDKLMPETRPRRGPRRRSARRAPPRSSSRPARPSSRSADSTAATTPRPSPSSSSGSPQGKIRYFLAGGGTGGGPGVAATPAPRSRLGRAALHVDHRRRHHRLRPVEGDLMTTATARDLHARPPPPRCARNAPERTDPCHSGRRRTTRGRRTAAWPSALGLRLLGSTAALYLVGLSESGWANQFYAAAAQSGSKSWKAFLFGSLDASNYITVDKPPASLWVMDVSVKLFGVNSWAVLVPQALEGVAAVALLYAAVRRISGTDGGAARRGGPRHDPGGHADVPLRQSRRAARAADDRRRVTPRSARSRPAGRAGWCSPAR